MMKTNGIYMTSLLAAVLLLAATSCSKKEVHSTIHPDTGKITVIADWSDRGEEVDIPAEWTVAMGDYTGKETGETHAPDYLFNPGEYTPLRQAPVICWGSLFQEGADSVCRPCFSQLILGEIADQFLYLMCFIL